MRPFVRVSMSAFSRRVTICFERCLLIASRQDILWNTELASRIISWGATIACPRNLAKPTGV